MKTGEWVRRAAEADGVIVIGRGQPVAKIVPLTDGDQGIAFSDRKLVSGFSDLPRIDGDSAAFIAEDRERG